MVTWEAFAEELGDEVGWGPLGWRETCEHRICLQSALRDERRSVIDGQSGDLVMLMPTTRSTQ